MERPKMNGVGRGQIIRDDFDPMKEAYNDPNFNSYMNVPGAAMKSTHHTEHRRREDKENIKMYVSSIPASMNEAGIKNIFLSVGDPLNVYLGAKTAGKYKWGFVEFRTVNEAQRALNTINKSPPHFLNVSYAIGEESKAETMREDNSEKEYWTKEDEQPVIKFPSRGPEIKDKILRFLMFQYNNKANGVYSYNKKPLKIGGVCSFCDRPAGFSCPICKTWYCSKICITEFKEKHDMICEPRSMNFLPNGTSYTTKDDCPWLEEPMAGGIDVAPWEMGGASKGPKVSNGHSDPSQVKKSSKKSHERRGQATNDQDDENSPSQEHHRDRVASRATRTNTRRGGRGGSASGSSKGEQQPYVRNTKPKFDNWEPKTQEESVPTSPKPIQGKAPIPTNTYSKVHITIRESCPGVYWVIPSQNVEECRKISESIHKYVQSGIAETLKPVVKTKCAAPYDGDWYRAKIVATDPCVKVLFVDFGNEHIVNPEQVKSLPPELLTRAPLAFKVKVASNSSPRCLKFEEAVELKIKPLYKEGPDMWVVHIEGEPDPEIPAELFNKNDFSPLKPDVFQNVAVTFFEGSLDYWVQLSSSTQSFVAMSRHLCDGTPTTSPPKLNEVYVHEFAGIWCRAKVTKDKPLEVFYIDYGNTERVSPSSLYLLPVAYQNVPPFAFKIRLGSNTPTKYKNLEFMSIFSVKPVSKSKDGVITCVAEDEIIETGGVPAPQPVEKIQHVLHMVQNNTKMSIKVTKVLSNDQLTGVMILNGVQNQSYASVEQISDIISSASNAQKPSFNLGDQIAMNVEGKWYRGYAMRTSPGENKVKRGALVDIGVVASSTEVVPLPKEAQLFAESGVRLLFGENTIPSDLEGSVLKIEVVEKVNSRVILTVSGVGQAEVLPWEPFFEEGGLPVVHLPSGSKAVITAVHSPKAIYVQSTSKENLQALERLSQDVASHSMNAPNIMSAPILGELVACKFDVDQTYYRAQVYKIIGNKYKVTFVDYGNQEVVPESNIKPLTNDLKQVPCMAVKIGLRDVPGQTFTPNAITYLNNLTDNLSQLYISYEDNDLSNTKIDLENGSSVNAAISKMQEESWKSKEGSLPFVLMAKDIKYCPWKKGSNVALAVVGKVQEHVFLALDRNSRLVAHSLESLTPKITQYCESFPPDEAYNPRVSELCLAKFSEDNQWYRAVCLKSFRTTSSIIFFDYGNSGEISHKDLRKMPPDFITDPALLKKCSVFGVPNSGLSKETLAEVDKFFEVESVHEARVVEDSWEDGVCLVWVPGLATKAIPGLPPIKCPNL